MKEGIFSLLFVLRRTQYTEILRKSLAFSICGGRLWATTTSNLSLVLVKVKVLKDLITIHAVGQWNILLAGDKELSIKCDLDIYFMPHLLASCPVLGNGCGHTLLGAQSGTLASQNYPGTYPSNSWCKWRLRVPERRTLRLLFGDFDIENSPGCSNGSVVISDKAGKPVIGTFSGFLSCSL